MCNDAKAKDVTLIAIGLIVHGVSEQDLRSSVAHGPTLEVVIGLHLMSGHQSQSEIDEFGLHVSSEDDVVWFDVSVDDVLLVAVLHDG